MPEPPPPASPYNGYQGGGYGAYPGNAAPQAYPGPGYAAAPGIPVYWTGPSIGFDAGGNGSRVLTLCYNLQYPDMIYRRYPGVEGTAYFIGGLGVNYQRADEITLAPIRTGIGFRLGANVGYLSYSREQHAFPF